MLEDEDIDYEDFANPNAGFGYMRQPFLDQATPCPGTTILSDAIVNLLQSGLFVVHLRHDWRTPINCWQDRICGDPQHEQDNRLYRTRARVISGVTAIQMTEGGSFLLETAEEYVSTLTEYGDYYFNVSEQVLRFAH